MTAFSITVTCAVAPPSVRLDIYSYIMDGGTERRATGVCRDYLALLTRMVADFEVANPSSITR